MGGFLRDNLFNKNSNDIDIEVYDVSKEKFIELMCSIEAKVLSEKFYVYCYDDIDISLPRVETKVSKGYHGFEIEITNDEFNATLRRDFTMNALMYNIFDNNLYDFHGGINDIKSNTLKIVNKQAFQEDSLRFIRAIRFIAQFHLNIDNESKNILSQMNIDELSKNRVYKELKKIF